MARFGTFTSEQYFVCSDVNTGIASVIHYIELPVGSMLATGQPEVQQFSDKQDARDYAVGLGHTTDFDYIDDPTGIGSTAGIGTTS